MALDIQRALAAVGEPTRFRIVELLASRARTVGEVASALGALQPQTTKHLQALEAAGIVRMHRLGRRRVARLDREAFAGLAAFFDVLATADPDDAALDDYERAIGRELDRIRGEAGESKGGGSGGGAGSGEGGDGRPGDRAGSSPGPRRIRIERILPASPADVLDAWTDPALAARWWAPRHFALAGFEFGRRAGDRIRVVYREGDGAEYESRGRVVEIGPRRLVFELAPVGPAGDPLFEASYALDLSDADGEDAGGSRSAAARAVLRIEARGGRAEAAPAIAGLEPGWSQLLDALAGLLRSGAEGAIAAGATSVERGPDRSAGHDA